MLLETAAQRFLSIRRVVVSEAAKCNEENTCDRPGRHLREELSAHSPLGCNKEQEGLSLKTEG